MFASLFLLLLGIAAFLDLVHAWVLWIYLGMSAGAFCIYGLDKMAARNGGRRTPETTLHLVALLGGWPGARLAQQMFRRKSAKGSFQAGFWLTVVANLAVLAYVLSPHGHRLASALHRMAH